MVELCKFSRAAESKEKCYDKILFTAIIETLRRFVLFTIVGVSFALKCTVIGNMVLPGLVGRAVEEFCLTEWVEETGVVVMSGGVRGTWGFCDRGSKVVPYKIKDHP